MSSSARAHHSASAALAGTGIPGLDDVLADGLTANRLYLLEGVPGFVKPTLAMQLRKLAPSKHSLRRAISTPCSVPSEVEPRESIETTSAKVARVEPVREVFDSPFAAMRNTASQ